MLLILTYSLIFMITIIAALMVVFYRNALYSALALITVMCAIAANFLMMRAELIALIQILVYAGAIMVLFLFVIMLLNLREGERTPIYLLPRKWIGLLMAGVFFCQISYICVKVLNIKNTIGEPIVMSEKYAASEEYRQSLTSIQAFATDLFSKYLIHFELTSILLLVAIVGALAIGLKDTPKAEEGN